MTDKKRRDPRSTPEWVSFIVAALILLALLGAIASLWISGADRPASFTVKQTSIEKRGNRYYVEADVSNNGDRTAEGVQVLAELDTGTDKPSEADQSIDFLSGGETQSVGFSFKTNPREGDLTVEVSGYNIP